MCVLAPDLFWRLEPGSSSAIPKRVQQGLWLLSALRRQSIDQDAADALKVLRGARSECVGKVGALASVSAASSPTRSGPHRCRLLGSAITASESSRLGVRTAPRSKGPVVFTSPNSTRFAAGEALEQGSKAAFPAAPMSNCICIRLDHAFAAPERTSFQQARDPDGAFAARLAVPKSTGVRITSFPRCGIVIPNCEFVRALGRSDHGDDGGGALRQSHPTMTGGVGYPRPAAASYANHFIPKTPQRHQG